LFDWLKRGVGKQSGEPIQAAAPLKAVTKRYDVFADYFQFYLQDEVERPEAPTDYTEEDIGRRIKAARFVVVIQPVRNMTVPVEVEVTDASPALVLEDWDHIAEASLELPSGRLEIHECTGGSIDVLPVPPGTYRARACFGGLDSLSHDGLDGDDRYRIVLWPAPFAPVQVLKYHEDPR
jgi:hypothetical protein